VKKVSIVMLLSMALSAESVIWNISYTGLRMDYREYNTQGQILDSEKSNLLDITGIGTSLELGLLTQDRARTSAVMSYVRMNGETEYMGSILGSGNPYGSVVSRTQNTITQSEACLKQALIDFNNEVYVNIGGGYRLWTRELSATQVEDYKWYYWKASLGGLYRVWNNMSIGGEIGYTQAIAPKMVANNPALEFNLHNVYSYNVSIPIVYKMTKAVALRIENQFERINIDDSDVNSGYYEPHSTSKNISTKIGVDFHF
jgi:hypothetical protein